MNSSSLTTSVYWWLMWFCGCLLHTPPPTLASGGYQLYGRPVAGPLQGTLNRGRVLTAQQRQTTTAEGQPEDQDASDTIGINFGVGFGLQESPLIDSLLERLLRRKQIMVAAAAAAAAAASAYPVSGWGAAGGSGVGAGYYPNPGTVFPYAGGVGGGPWNRPTAFPYPFVPPINAFGGSGSGWGGGGWGNGGGWGPFGSGGGGGFNPLFDYDNDFSWKNSKPRSEAPTFTFTPAR